MPSRPACSRLEVYLKTASSISPPPRRSPRRRQHFPGRTIWCGRGRRRRARRPAPLRALARRRAVPASLRPPPAHRGALGRSRCPWAGRAPVPGLPVIAPVRSHRRPLLPARPREAHRSGSSTHARAVPAPAPDDPELAVRAFGLDSQSGRARGRLRQAWRGTGRAVAARLRLRRGRHRDAAAATGQSAAAAVPPRCPTRRYQPLWLQQRGRAAAAPAARDRGGIVGVNVGANKDPIDRVADYVA